MPVLRTHHRERAGTPPFPGFSQYVTDGTRLFRVVSGFAGSPPDNFAALEDCMTLEIAPYTPEQLWKMQLQPVRGSYAVEMWRNTDANAVGRE
jgi:hypothetical protein